MSIFFVLLHSESYSEAHVMYWEDESLPYLGLVVFIIAALFTMLAPTFTLMLTGFGCCAFEFAAVGLFAHELLSVMVIKVRGELSHVFSIVELYWYQPCCWVLAGSWLTSVGGYKWVFMAIGGTCGYLTDLVTR
ncbi:hypothetical protein OK016_30165 [Vibrio chagasii]|nr:hypothetical protein [Vibrio chagasii]